MAQLPPKVPNMTPNWPPDFPHQRMASMENLASNTTTPAAAAQLNLSWVDEFLDFSSAKRGCHRRSISDSIAFIEEPPMLEECRRSSAPGGASARASNEFDRFNDDQLMSMFADDEVAVAPITSLSNASSTPSHHHDDKPAPLDQMKNEAEEVQSSCKSEPQLTNTNATTENSTDKINIDPKRVKRILANRQSAQRSRVRKLQYISELERSVNSLQVEVSVLSPRVAYLDHQRLILNVDNGALKQRIAALAQDRIFKDDKIFDENGHWIDRGYLAELTHQEALRREIERLRKVYEDQNLKKMENAKPPSSDANGSTENEQLILN